MRLSLNLYLGLTAVMTLSMTAQAQEAGGSAGFSLSSEGSSASAEGDGSGDDEHNRIELGFFGGVMFPSDESTLRDYNRPPEVYDNIAPDIGIRGGFYPIKYLGLELEGALIPTAVSNGGSATVFAPRAHVLGQFPTKHVIPFAVLGWGRLLTTGDAIGDDGDPAFHFGIGAKVPLSESVHIRLDLRDTVSNDTFLRENQPDSHHYPEILLGFGFGFGKPKPPPPPPDSDGDGFLDRDDKCPNEPGVAPDGCPIRDSDGDGILDDRDKCPDVPGIEPDGCPDPDPDKDGILNDRDKCPDEPGIEPDGCPDPDRDKDGILNDDDKCPDAPETRNGFEDDDGCPDELPEKVKQFTGVIKGIEFDFGKATIRKASHATLDNAYAVLAEFPSLRVLISGHTDSVGSDERNMELSQQRADSVKQYLVDKGLDASRVETKGEGPNRPVADNETAAGRQENRRIEFELLMK